MLNPIFTHDDQIRCTFGCTNMSQVSPNTVKLASLPTSILVKTREPFLEVCPVAPNVAGSIPVSHPKIPQCLCGYS
jgi:hypothetical protein